MKIKYKAPAIVIGVMLLLTVVSTYSSYTDNVTLIEKGIESQFTTVTNLIASEILSESSRAASLASLVVNLPQTKEIMHARDRDRLIEWIVPNLKLQHERYDIEQVHFHTPPATSFLRLKNLDKWGDDLSSTREMVLKANKNLYPLQGIEVGSTGMNIRAIDVIKDDKEGFGSMEVEVSFANILDKVKNITGFDGAAFVDEQIMERIATLAPKPDPEQIIGGYRNVSATDWDFIKPFITPTLLRKVHDTTYKVFRADGKYLGMIIIPLLDFKGVQIGYIVSLHEFTRYQTELSASLARSIAYGLLQALILAASLLVVINVLLINPLNTIDENFKKVFNGDKDVDVSKLSQNDDEIGSLARYLEKTNTLVKESLKGTSKEKGGEAS